MKRCRDTVVWDGALQVHGGFGAVQLYSVCVMCYGLTVLSLSTVVAVLGLSGGSSPCWW